MTARLANRREPPYPGFGALEASGQTKKAYITGRRAGTAPVRAAPVQA